MKPPLHLLLLSLGLVALVRPQVRAQTCSQITKLDYTANGTPTGDRRAATATAGGTTITTSGYSTTVAGGNTNTFAVGTNAALPSKALVWQQNTQGATGATAGQPTAPATVTYTFSRPVTNLTLELSDIDQDITAAKFTDQMTLDGYVNAADATPVTLVAGNVTAGNSNAFVAGSNAVRGTGTSAASASDNATVRFTQPIMKLVLSYQNTYAYNAADDRTQTMGINFISFCSQADVYAQFTAGPATATTGQNVAYTVAFGNNGPDIAATTVTRKVTLPTGAVVTSAGGGTVSGNTIDFGNVTSLAAGTSASFTYAYILPAVAGTYNNGAAITAGTTATAYDPTPNNSANRSVLVSAGAGACTTAPVDLDYRTRTAPENWKAKASEGVPAPASVTKVSTSYTSADANSTFALATLNGPTLGWSVDYAGNGGAANTSTVTYTFSRPVSNFSVRVQDIDGARVAAGLLTAASGYTDDVTFDGADAGGTAVTPTVTKVVAASTVVSVAGNRAFGNTIGTTSADDGAVIASFSNPIKTLTITYRNTVTNTARELSQQAVGIDLMSWCRLVPVANNVTTTTLPSTAGQVNINGLSSTVDGMVQTYTLTSVPTPAQGLLYYNATGSTYVAATAGQALTEAQAATLRFDPATGASGNITFGYTVQDDAELSSNAATYTIPVNNTTCTVNTTAVNFASRPAGEDWKAHAAESFPAGSPLTTLRSGAYTTPASATASTFLTAAFNGVQSLQWTTDYANTTANSSSVTFTFSRPVSNFTMRVQDIDAAQDNANAFVDRVTVSGALSGTTVTPVLSAANPDNGSVIISGNTATGTVNNTSPDDATVVAYFATPITSLTLTYANVSTFNTNPTQQAIGIDLVSWCQLAPTATAITNATLPVTAPQTAISPLVGTADGVIQSYTLGALPAVAAGILYVNGVAATAGQVLTPAQAAQLTFDPAPGFTGTQASFTYTTTDGQNNVSAPATYVVPISPVADVTTTIAGPASLIPGQPSGTYTATFTDNGPSGAAGVTQRVTLPAGVTAVMVPAGASYDTFTRIIDFGTVALASGATNSYAFSFTAPATPGSVAVVSNVTTTTPQGADAAQNAATLAATVQNTANVSTTIMAGAATATAGQSGTFNVTFANAGPATAAGVVPQVQLPAGLTNVVASNGGVYNSATGVVSYAGITSLNTGTSQASAITFTAPATGRDGYGQHQHDDQ